MINKHYLQNIEQLKNAFNKNKELPHIALFDFFEQKSFEALKNKLQSIPLKHEKVPLTHSYAQAQVSIFNDDLFNFISTIIAKKVSSRKQTLLQFKHKDYTILNDANQELPGYDVFFDITENWKDEWGGSVIYTDGSGDYTKLPIRRNTFMIVQRKKGVQRFVKYVNNKSVGNERRLLFFQVHR